MILVSYVCYAVRSRLCFEYVYNKGLLSIGEEFERCFLEVVCKVVGESRSFFLVSGNTFCSSFFVSVFC